MSENGKSGWNRSAGNQPTAGRGAKGGVRSAKKVLCALCLVLFAVLGICIWLFSGGDGAPKREAAKDRGLIKEVTPAKAPAESEVTTNQDPHAGMYQTKGGAWYKDGEPSHPFYTKHHDVITNQPRRVRGPRVTSSMTEQVLLQLFSVRPGQTPPPLPSLPPKEKENLVAILISKNPVTDEDSARVKMSKEILQQAKDAMREYIKEGGSPDEFLKYYHDELKKSFNTRNDAQKLISSYIKEGEDPEVVEKMIDSLNERLRSKGIQPLDRIRRKVRK